MGSDTSKFGGNVRRGLYIVENDLDHLIDDSEPITITWMDQNLTVHLQYIAREDYFACLASGKVLMLGAIAHGNLLA